MATNDTGRPTGNSNLLLTSSSDNQRDIGIENSMRERFERALPMINWFNTRAQSYTGDRSFRTPRNLTTVTTDTTWDGSARIVPTNTASWEQDEITWPKTRWITEGAAAQQDIVEGRFDERILMGDEIAESILKKVDDLALDLMKTVDVTAVIRDYTDKTDTTQQTNAPLGTTAVSFLGARGKRSGTTPTDLGLLEFFSEMAVELSNQLVGQYGARGGVVRNWPVLVGNEIFAEFTRATMEKNVDSLIISGMQFTPNTQQQTIFTLYPLPALSKTSGRVNMNTTTGKIEAASSASTKLCYPIFFIRPEAFTFGVRDRAVAVRQPFSMPDFAATWYTYYTSQVLMAADDLRAFWTGGVYGE